MAGWFTALTALAAASATSTPVPPSALEAGLADAEVLVVSDDPYSRLTVPVKIDGEGPFRFMIDTGAQATVLSLELAERLSLSSRGSAVLVGMASRRPIETASVDGIELGSRFFNIARAPLVARAHIGAADGILGLDSLQDQRVLIDFGNDRIAVADAEALGGNAGYEIVVKARRQLGQLIVTEARLNGIKVAVLIDTGAQGTIGNPALLGKLRSKEHATTDLTDINGVRISGSIHLARELRIGGVRLTQLPIFFTETPTFEALGLHDKPALVLGMNELKLFKRVAIDFRTKRILFDLPRGTVRGPGLVRFS